MNFHQLQGYYEWQLVAPEVEHNVRAEIAKLDQKQTQLMPGLPLGFTSDGPRSANVVLRAPFRRDSLDATRFRRSDHPCHLLSAHRLYGPAPVCSFCRLIEITPGALQCCGRCGEAFHMRCLDTVAHQDAGIRGYSVCDSCSKCDGCGATTPSEVIDHWPPTVSLHIEMCAKERERQKA